MPTTKIRIKAYAPDPRGEATNKLINGALFHVQKRLWNSTDGWGSWFDAAPSIYSATGTYEGNTYLKTNSKGLASIQDDIASGTYTRCMYRFKQVYTPTGFYFNDNAYRMVQISNDVPTHQYNAQVTYPYESYVDYDDLSTTSWSATSDSLTPLTWSNYKNTIKVTVKKLDTAGNPLAGASFNAWMSDPGVSSGVNNLTTKTTNSNGIATFNFTAQDATQNCRILIQETAAPTGYNTDATPLTCMLRIHPNIGSSGSYDVYWGDTINFDTSYAYQGTSVSNPKGNLIYTDSKQTRTFTITCKALTAGTNVNLEGAQFSVDYTFNLENWSSDGTYTTDENGLFSFSMAIQGAEPRGNTFRYRIKQISAPNGYEFYDTYYRYIIISTELYSGTGWPAVIGKDGVSNVVVHPSDVVATTKDNVNSTLTKNLIWESYPNKVTIKVKKTDTHGDPLQGATFQAWLQDPGEITGVNNVITKTTNANGVATFNITAQDPRLYCRICIREYSPPTGFNMDDPVITRMVRVHSTVAGGNYHFYWGDSINYDTQYAYQGVSINDPLGDLIWSDSARVPVDEIETSQLPTLYDEKKINYGVVPKDNGLGILTDAISCLVTEELDGMYELELEYPETGLHTKDIKLRHFIKARPNYNDDPQLFRIYKIGKVINNSFKVYARHVAYDLSGSSITSGSVKNLEEACILLSTKDFNIYTNKTVTNDFIITEPSSVRSWFGGKDGSLIDRFGDGEFYYNNFHIYFLLHRGTDRGVNIRYGKNIISLNQDRDASNLTTHIILYWRSNEDNRIIYSGKVSTGVHLDCEETQCIDVTSEFEFEPVPEALTQLAEEYVQNNNYSVALDSITLDYLQLDSLSDRVDIGDTVHIKYEGYNIDKEARCIKTTWDVLRRRYTSCEFGDLNPNFADTFVNSEKKVIKLVNNWSERTKQSIRNATSLITGNAGGYVVLHDSNDDGEPDEILIMNTPDINTATKVWRWNNSGLGFSNTGYDGIYDLAMTIDGQIVANFITAGTMSADHIRAGKLESTNGLSFWDLDNSVFKFYDDLFDSSVILDQGFIEFRQGDISFGRILRMLLNNEPVLTIRGTDAENYLMIGQSRVLLKATNNTRLSLTGDSDSRGGWATLYANASTYLQLNAASQLIYLTAGTGIFGNLNAEKKYIDWHAGDNNWIRIDDKNKYVWISCDDLIVNGRTGWTGTFTTGNNKTVFVYNGIISQVT